VAPNSMVGPFSILKIFNRIWFDIIINRIFPYLISWTWVLLILKSVFQNIVQTHCEIKFHNQFSMVWDCSFKIHLGLTIDFLFRYFHLWKNSYIAITQMNLILWYATNVIVFLILSKTTIGIVHIFTILYN